MADRILERDLTPTVSLTYEKFISELDLKDTVYVNEHMSTVIIIL